MNDKEKEAIDYLKKLDIMFIASGLKKRTRQAIKIILNLIDKLQKDNYKLDRENQLRFENNIELQKENEIKDKVIDKLAQWVANSCPLIDKQTAKDIIYTDVYKKE